jgi:hypothetical protein
MKIVSDARIFPVRSVYAMWCRGTAGGTCSWPAAVAAATAAAAPGR